MRTLPLTAVEDLLEIIMRCYERVSDVAAVTAMLDGSFIMALCSSAARGVGVPRQRRRPREAGATAREDGGHQTAFAGHMVWTATRTAA